MTTTSSSEPFEDPKLAERLEHGELIHGIVPSLMPDATLQAALTQQELQDRHSRCISYHPRSQKVEGRKPSTPTEQVAFIQTLLRVSQRIQSWLKSALPYPMEGAHLEAIHLHVVEEALRTLPPEVRKDVLHLDFTFPYALDGWRKLTVVLNLHPTQEWVWITSETFASLLTQYGKEVGLPGQRGRSWTSWARSFPRLLGQTEPSETELERFLVQFNRFLRKSDQVQEKSIKRARQFEPGSLWMAMTDGISHAVLRGQYAIEHTFLIPPHFLHFPEQAPVAILRQRTAQEAA